MQYLGAGVRGWARDVNKVFYTDVNRDYHIIAGYRVASSPAEQLLNTNLGQAPIMRLGFCCGALTFDDGAEYNLVVQYLCAMVTEACSWASRESRTINL